MNPTTSSNSTISKHATSISVGIQPSQRPATTSTEQRAAPAFPQLHQVASHKLFRQFGEAAESNATIEGFLQAVAVIVSEHSANLALWISRRNEQEQFDQIHAIADENASVVWQLVESTCRQITPFVVKSKQVCSAPVQQHAHYQIVAAPVTPNDKLDYILYGCFSSQNETVLRQQWLMGILSQALVSWVQSRRHEQSKVRTKSLNDALTLIQNLDQTTNVRQASMAIVNHLRRLCEAEQVSLSFCSHQDHGELAAISDVESIELGSESNKVINHACNQAIVEQAILTYPNADNVHSPALLPLEQYCKSNRLQACVNFPLLTRDGIKLGALLIATNEERIRQPEFIDYITRLGPMISGHFDVVLRANRGLNDLAKSQLKKIRHAPLTKPVLTAIAFALMILCIPMPYRVACHCKLQPVMRRFIAAPYDGILKQTLVQYGDLVQKDQILASMDGRQLRIRLSGLRAEHNGAKKRRDSSLAKSDFAEAQIALSEMNRLEAEIELLEQQVVNLEIRSPIDGIIVSGDLEQVEGAPLKMGQTLYEVGPLNEMLAEVAIPEAEIQYVAAGMPVTLKLDSFPFKTWNGEIQRIHPSTELVDNQSVFVAQVKMDNDDLSLRPGLKGSAKIRSNSFPLGWNLFHRAWETVRYWTIW